jgi:phospholipid/cholesterol/gamma-HCH transport system substrate-binding protein
VSGLNPQATVRYRGLAVGRVSYVGFDPAVTGQILIRIGIAPNTPVTPSTFATLSSQGVTGIAFVQLDDDGSKSGQLRAFARIPLHPSMIETLEQRGNRLLANAELLTARMSELLAPANQQLMMGTFAKTAELTQHWSQVAETLTPTLQQLPMLTEKTVSTLDSVQKLADDTRQTSNQITQLVGHLQTTAAPLNQALSSVERLSDTIGQETLPRINTLSNQATISVRTLNRTLEQVNSQPQSLLFGKAAPAPGPGELGFVAPIGHQP